jgi:hypothetical protein
MGKPVPSLEQARNRLRALRAEKPATAGGQIRWAWPEIKAALDVGHSLKTVHERLTEVGIELPYRRLSHYVTRLRREETEQAVHFSAQRDRVAAETPGTTEPKSAPEPAAEPNGRDPLANLRRLSTSRPGFRWDEGPPNKDKLF